ncbi:hypothetical protein AGOR_G00221360 [Albula goreensis]|uniref:Uncharacterized protein n=1 Tax=Albula goreensis TaxID=1534307 RepID=A0A8T3CIZ6_9TELE|nr:hypothetical protein AGOR_G00221360 [Albula goreensis]
MPMYQVKPICGGDVKIDMPTCMYKLPNVHAPRSGCGEHAHQNGEVDPAVRALEVRQDEILRRLYELKAAVDGLAKTVTTPDADLDATTIPQQGGASATLTGTADLDSLLGKRAALLHLQSALKYAMHSSTAWALAPHSYIRQRFQLGFTLIWKDVPKTQMKFSVQSMCPIEGEGNVARFLFKLLGVGPRDPAAATLSTAGWTPACSSWPKSGSAPSAPPNVQRWLKSCENLGHFARAAALLH